MDSCRDSSQGPCNSSSHSQRLHLKHSQASFCILNAAQTAARSLAIEFSIAKCSIENIDKTHKTLAEEFFIAGCCTDGSQDSSIIELHIAITAAETLARNAVDFLTANNTTTNTIIRCTEVEFQKLESSIYDNQVHCSRVS
jgi:hypothetical protein